MLGPAGKDRMITDTFDSRTMANMEIALERACAFLPTGNEKHRVRRIIASKIIECANRGESTLSTLTEAGYVAAMQLAGSGRSVRNGEAR
jgi:predicted dienelactone hydrolase